MSSSRIPEIRKYIETRVKIEAHGFDTPCWQWLPSTNLQGYAQGHLAGTTVRMARISHEVFKGLIPDGLQIDHLCRNRRCVNPEHLEAVTAAENARRRNWKRTICLHGHPFEGDNIKVFASGHRTCRICNDAWWAAKLEMRKAERREAAA